MRMPPEGFTRGMVLGVTLGLVVGSTGVAAAAFGKKGWERWGSMFQGGYVAGFVDCVRVAKAREGSSLIALSYMVPVNAKAVHWQSKVSELYAKKENHNRPMSQIMAMAGNELVGKLGPDVQGSDGLQRLRQFLEKRKKRLQEKAKAEGAETEKAPKAAGTPDRAATGTEDRFETKPGGERSAKSAGVNPAEPQPEKAVKQ